MSAITTRNLTRQYRKFIALDSLNLRIPRGSLYGLVGSNGAGKTTTLRLIAGLLDPSSGEIRVNGLRMDQYWYEIRWLIGYMPDHYGMYEDLFVWEYLDFFARCYRIIPRYRQRITQELLELVDLTKKKNDPIKSLSRGMRQKLCLAQTLIHDPKILLLDEPASGLDPLARIEMRALLLELRNMGKTLLVSSHILGELGEMCDGIALLEGGKLVYCGTITDLRTKWNPKRRFEIQILSNFAQAESLLRQYPQVEEFSKLPELNMLEIIFSGDDEKLADLIERMVKEKVRLLSFKEIQNGLEDSFMKLSKNAYPDAH